MPRKDGVFMSHVEDVVTPTGRDGRLLELDSLRGLAALTVVFSHVLGVIPTLGGDASPNGLATALINTPLHIFWAGTEAVSLFFVLSGFVLSLPFHGSRHGTYREYLTRRICRIYLPYVAAVIFALGMRALLAGRDVQGLSGLVKKMWNDPFGWFDAFFHATLIVLIPNGAQSDPPHLVTNARDADLDHLSPHHVGGA